MPLPKCKYEANHTHKYLVISVLPDLAQVISPYGVHRFCGDLLQFAPV